MKYIVCTFFLLFVSAFAWSQTVQLVKENGYENCIEIKNADTRLVLEPNAGGRVLVYAYKGVNVMYLDTAQNGWTTAKGKLPNTHLCGGRCDIGPSKMKPNTDLFFFGSWKGQITGKNSARLTSQVDPKTGLQLIRDFTLDAATSHLTFTQKIINRGKEMQHVCHWGRTFVEGGGICVLPVSKKTRLPKHYLIYGPGNVMDFMPEEPNISVTDGLLSIVAPPTRPKLVMDASEGWIAYVTRSNRLFVKKFPVFFNRVYGEMSACNTSIWYNGDQMCEIEPTGPWEELKPGKQVAFTEDWYVTDFAYPGSKAVDAKKIQSVAKTIQ